MQPLSSKQFNTLLMVIILAAWTGLNLFYNWGVRGHDLASGYIAAHVLHQGQIDHLYSYDPSSFTDVIDPVWLDIADRTGCGAYLHPYVQIPLWAGLLEPVAVRLAYPDFRRISYLLILLCFAGSFLLAFKMWAPEFLAPLPLLVFLVLISVSVSFRYSILLLQTHPILFFFIMLALYLDKQDKSFLAGLIMAFPIAVKVTPGIFILYWLLFRRWRAIAGSVAGGATLGGLSLLLTSWQAHLLFLERLRQIGSMTLTGYSNQSIRGFLMRAVMGSGSIEDWSMHPTPAGVKLAALFLVLVLFAVTVYGLYRARKHLRQLDDVIISLFIVLLLVCPPLSWMHYYFMLFIPAIVLYKHVQTEKSMFAGIVLVLVILLQIPIFTYAPFANQHLSLVRLINYGLYAALLIYGYMISRLYRLKPSI